MLLRSRMCVIRIRVKSDWLPNRRRGFNIIFSVIVRLIRSSFYEYAQIHLEWNVPFFFDPISAAFFVVSTLSLLSQLRICPIAGICCNRLPMANVRHAATYRFEHQHFLPAHTSTQSAPYFSHLLVLHSSIFYISTPIFARCWLWFADRKKKKTDEKTNERPNEQKSWELLL